MRIKKGKVVVMPDDDHTADLGYAALTGLSMIGDDLTGSFTEPRGAIRSFSMLRAAAAKSTRVLVTGEHFAALLGCTEGVGPGPPFHPGTGRRRRAARARGTWSSPEATDPMCRDGRPA